jgi:hypothetical protein
MIYLIEQAERALPRSYDECECVEGKSNPLQDFVVQKILFFIHRFNFLAPKNN